MKKSIIAAFIIALGLAACGGKQEVSFASLEEAKGTARDNAMWNAQMYRQSNVLLKDNDIIGRGDSSQTNDCPQGDGWATMEFVSQAKRVTRVKCSTVSSNTGCMEDADFKNKPFASDDGHCQPTNKVPYPLPKIAK